MIMCTFGVSSCLGKSSWINMRFVCPGFLLHYRYNSVSKKNRLTYILAYTPKITTTSKYTQWVFLWMYKMPVALPFNGTSINCRSILIPFMLSFLSAVENCWLVVEKWLTFKLLHSDCNHTVCRLSASKLRGYY